MTTRLLASHRGRYLLPLLLLPLLSAAVGCKSKPVANIEVTSLETSRDMTQTFNRAYFSRSEGGDYDLVLLEEAVPNTTGRAKGAALESTDVIPLTHIMHIRVLWRPKRAIRPDSPTATNAAIHWTVLAGDGSGRIDYDGVGFANVYGSDDQVRALLRNMQLKPTSRSGNMGDPMGAMKIEADFKATSNPKMVRAALELMRPAPEAPTNPPPRPPGP